ncbi:MAG: long-chain fatty acid--CoA ligase [Bdellovibrionales bacterium]|nr:long-chain fatty acid--CoA ligase [Bdellovibrionales bacterium]
MTNDICKHFLKTVDTYPNEVSVVYKNTTWLKETWLNYQQKVAFFSQFLLQQKVKAKDTIAILSETRYNWAICDLSILSIGCVTTPIYASNTPEDIEYILNNSEAKVLIIDTLENYHKWEQVKDRVKAVKTVICFNHIENVGEDNIFVWEDALKSGYSDDVVSKLRSNIEKIKIDDLATIVYTSGTTGKPKGVMLTHQQIMSEVTDIFALANINQKDSSLSFLPMAHIMGRIEIWGHVYAGFKMGYAENIETLRSNFLTIKPTFIVSVPRIFEKIYNGVISQAEASPLRTKLFKWAVSIGKEVSEKTHKNESLPLDLLAKYKIAKKLVFDKLIEKMGGNIRYAIAGGAPLSQEIAEFFHASGLLVLEGYGLTETTGGVSFNAPYAYKFGTVGKPIGDVEISFKEDGEILVRSKKVMAGYFKRPEDTSSVLQDGWLHTGDIGTLTHDGFLKITDRKKDLIKTSGGKYVAPQKIENLLKLNKFISNVLVHGDQKKYIVCLITLNIENIKQELLKKGVSFTNPAGLSTHTEVLRIIREAISDVNQQLASFETIKNFAILNSDFTIENGELTPSLKVRRKFCDEKYKDTINALYGVDASTF